MAELIIATVALGSMYVISNHSPPEDKPLQNRSNKTLPLEGYENMGKPQNTLHTVNPPAPQQPRFPAPENYPVAADRVADSNINKYRNPNQTTDKYFDNTVYERIEKTNPPGDVGSGVLPTMSLTGDIIDKSHFKHNNMQPFFGAKIKGATVSANVQESVLDNMQGQGSQMRRKQAQAPLFKPHANLQYANGAPNASDFLQSRVNPSMRMANVKPWEEVQVAPGLNKGYNAAGGAGFNSGMESRDSWLPKTVNELRVDTNPKMTFGLDGHQGPANAYIKESANTNTQGKIEKNKPDTYYTVGAERWFTTTGLEKGQTARGREVLQHVNRPTTTCEYFGAGDAEGEAGYVPGEYAQSRRPELPCTDITNAGAAGMHAPTASDHGAKSYQNLPNNRSTTRQAEEFGGVGGMLKAMVAPLLDVMRPSRKEDTVGNLRPTGNAASTVPQQPIYNPADRTRTTIRETTEGKLDNNHLNINSQIDRGSGAYLVSKQQPVTVQRDTTNCSYDGAAGPAVYGGNQVYDAAYRQRNNVNKGYKNRPNQGGTQIFNQTDNIQIDKRDCDRNNNRLWAPSATQQHIPSTDTYGKVNAPQYYDECKGCERIAPDILTAFKDNPYTQSLQSWA
jgi:hypothetical protein